MIPATARDALKARYGLDNRQVAVLIQSYNGELPGSAAPDGTDLRDLALQTYYPSDHAALTGPLQALISNGYP